MDSGLLMSDQWHLVFFGIFPRCVVDRFRIWKQLTQIRGYKHKMSAL